MKFKRKSIVVIMSIVIIAAGIVVYMIYVPLCIPSQFLGRWKVNIRKTVDYNEGLPEWQEIYQDNMVRRKQVLGYDITKSKIAFTVDGKGIPVRFKLKTTTPSQTILTVTDKVLKKNITISLIVIKNNVIAIKSDMNKFYMVYDKVN